MLLEPVDTAKARQLLNQSMALVLAGGRGSRLKQLTDNRAKPAVHFGGKFRIIDFVLSNCINSGIRRVGVVTQYKSHSLLRHLQSGWSFLRYQMNEFIDLLPGPLNGVPSNLTVVGRSLYFHGFTETTGSKVFRSDGTREGTVLLADTFLYRHASSVPAPTIRSPAKPKPRCPAAAFCPCPTS